MIGRWSRVPDLPFFPVHTHVLPTGKVMIWPGDISGEPPGVSGNDPRLWDPATAAVSPLTPPGYDVFCSGHAFLADGRLFVAGGHIQNDVGLPSATTYDPINNAWTQTPNMNAGRWYPTVTTLANGDMLVVSGRIDNTVGENLLPGVFQAGSSTWRHLTNAQISLDLYPRMHLAPNGRVFNSAPSTVTRYLDTSGTGVWTVVANRSNIYRDYGSSVMYDDGKVLVMGGSDPPTNTAEVIDLNAPKPAWRSVASMAFVRRQLNATLLPDGKVLVTGGTSGPGFNNTDTPVFAAEIWDPATENWTTMASAQIPRLYHSAVVLLPDGRLLSTGGNGYPQTEVYEPPYLFKGSRPTINSAPASISYGQTFFVETPDVASITQVTWIRLSSTTHAFNMNQWINRLSFSQVAGGLNVVAPSNANLVPPGHYMLFILNGNGVPSVAKIIQVTSGPGGGPASIALSFNGQIRDRVGGGETALSADGAMDGTFTVTLNPSSGNRTVTRLDLARAGGGNWDTQPNNGFWVVGAASTLDAALLNAANGTVNFPLTAGSSFNIFASNFEGGMFVTGSSFTLTVSFADGSTATASVSIGAPALPTVTVAATDANAAEAGLPIRSFTVTRTGATTAALTVNYTVGGTATAGTDYQALSGSVVIAAGSASATITVTPIKTQ